MKKILVLSIITVLFACTKKENISYTLFSGKVSNTDSDKLVVVGKDFKQEIAINEDGSFSDTLNIENEGYYSFYINRESSALYLNKGATLDLSIDVKEFDETIKYTGSIAEENNLLANKYMITEETQGEREVFYAKDEAAFLAAAKETLYKIEAATNATNTNEAFKKQQIENSSYEYAIALMKYERYHRHYAKEKEFELSDSFMDNQIDFEINDESAYKNSGSYRDLVSNVFDESVNEAYAETQDYSAAVMSAADKMENKYIKEELLNENSRHMLSPNESLKEVYDYLMANTSNETYKSDYSEAYDNLKLLAKGMPSPTFENYENHKGGTSSFEDLKGKYTYIDVWATWCGPCIGEIPSLKAVEEEFHERNIQFVSASIDKAKDHDTWVKMVSDKELGGIQLMADKDWSSKFVRDYQINGIPRFILVDPEGLIVSADAPRPSDPKLKELLEELNI